MSKSIKQKYSSQQRGVAMIVALFLIFIVVVIAVGALESVSNSARNSLGVQTKNQTFNTAETGLDTAIYKIDTNNNIASGSSGSGTASSYTYNWEVVQNNL